MGRFTRAEAIAAYKEARDNADLILVGYVLENPGENLQGLCKDADPDGWDALRKRVQRRVEKARSEGTSGRPSTPARSRQLKYEIKQAASEDIAAVMSDPEVRHIVYDALDRSEVSPVSRPSRAAAQRTSSESRNASALARLADMHTAAQQANTLVDHDALTDHQRANAEVALRATESEIAVWREHVGGGISDEAIAALIGEGA